MGNSSDSHQKGASPGDLNASFQNTSLRGWGCRVPAAQALPCCGSDTAFWDEGAGGGALHRFPLHTISFPTHLLSLFWFCSHLSLVFGGKKHQTQPNPSPNCVNLGQRQHWDRITEGKHTGFGACPFLFLLILFNSSCASIFIEGKRRKTDCNPRKAEHLVIISEAWLAQANTGSREWMLTTSAALISQIWVIREGKQDGSDVEHALNISGIKGADGQLSLLLEGAGRQPIAAI